MKKTLLIVTVLATTFLNAQPFFLGMNDAGGLSNNGNIFSFDAATNNFVNEHEFYEPEGTGGSQQLAEYNGRLYGSISNYIFSYNLNNEDYQKHGSSGGGASGNLIVIGNKLYGVTLNWGTNLQGTIFEYNPANETTITLYNFDNNGTSSGRNPVGGLLQATNGKLYGMTNIGGINNDGVIFSYDLNTNTFVKLFDFDASTTGEQPQGEFIQASNGLLYGFTKLGGTNSRGTIFSFNTTTNTHTVLHQFAPSTGGNYPKYSFLEASNGELYAISDGDIIKFNITTNTYYRTTMGGLASSLEGNFIEPIPGKLYAQGYGQKIIEYDLLTDSLIVIHDPMGINLTNNYGSWTNTHGLQHNNSLIKASNGKLYGSTYRGGIAGKGVLFEYDIALDSMKTKFHFGLKTISKAQGVLMEASNGKFYGCSREGGTYNFGTLFEYDEATNVTTVLFHFKDSMGVIPRNLIEENGIIYGIGHGFYYGSVNRRGIVFKYNIAQNTHSFNANTSGSFVTQNPVTSGFIKAANGHLYSLLGDQIVHYDIAQDTLIVDKAIYSGIRTPRGAEGMLFQASNGLLYGTSTGGGLYNEGTLFSYDITLDTLVIVQNLYAGIGKNPTGAPVEAANGRLYFTAYGGGTNSDGTILEYNPTTGSTVRKQNFNSSSGGTGQWPSGHLTLASDGNIYGIATGGVSGGFDGVIFKYQPGTTNLSRLYAYGGLDGNPFPNNGLIEYTPTITSINSIEKENEEFKIYPNPSRGTLNIESNEIIKEVEIYNGLGTIIAKKIFHNKSVNLNLLNVANGLYFIRINQSPSLKKLIIN